CPALRGRKMDAVAIYHGAEHFGFIKKEQIALFRNIHGKRAIGTLARSVGSRTGYSLQGEVHGGMTLVFACRGPPGCSDTGYFAAVWLPFGRGFPGGILPPGCSAPACACFVLWPAASDHTAKDVEYRLPSAV